MIIDRILDRKDGLEYNPGQFYRDCLAYGRVGDDITRAMDGGTEEDVKRSLCQYIRENEYNPLLIDYINRINWIGETDLAVELAAAKAFDKACDIREAFALSGKFPDNQFIMAVQDEFVSPTSDEYTGENIKALRVCDSIEDLGLEWNDVLNSEEGNWYWVFANGECICSGAVDPGDLEIFKDYFGVSFDELSRQPHEKEVVESFREKTEECFNKIGGYSAAEIETMAKQHLLSVIEKENIDVEIADVVVVGSRCRGLEKNGSDLDIVVEFKSDAWREDSLFNLLREDEHALSIGGVPVDFNPISEKEISGSLTEYLPKAEAYLAIKKVRAQMEEQNPSISRSTGVAVNGGYVVGGGFRGLTDELDSIVKQEAQILYNRFNTDIVIRFNSDRMSGGAWLVDSTEDTLGSNCNIGLCAKLYNSQIKSMDPMEFLSLPFGERDRLVNTPDSLGFETAINLKNTEHSISPDSPHIVLDSEYRDFNTLEDAVEYLFAHVKGIKNMTQKPSLATVISQAAARAKKTKPMSKDFEIEQTK